MSKLEGIKPGDRVRVTFEGEMSETSAVHFWPVVSDGMSAPTMWVMPDVHCPPQIERIEPPLKVGDRVNKVEGGKVVVPNLTVIGIFGEWAWVERDGYPFSSYYASCLERIA